MPHRLLRSPFTCPSRPAASFLAAGFVLLLALLQTGCSPLRFVEDGEAMLSSVKMTSDDKHVSPGSYRSYIRQEANSKWFSLAKVPLGIYCLQGKDSTKRFNRFIRRIGEAPVIYDATLAEYSRAGVESALQGAGYLHARVDLDTARRGKKVSATYHLHPGICSYVRQIRYAFDDADIERLVLSDSASSLLYKGMPLDMTQLNAERSRIIDRLKDMGYFLLHKEYITFAADTAAADNGVLLTLRFRRPAGSDSLNAYQPFRLRNIHLYEDSIPGAFRDTVSSGVMQFHYRDKLKMLRRVYGNHVFLHPDSLYRERDVEDTYRSLNGLPPIQFTSIRFREVPDSRSQLDCDILVRHNKPHSISVELEGTNTSGNLGAAVVLSYNNRNLFRGAEALSLKLRGAYEAITGLEGYNNQNYLEYSGEVGLRFPTLLFPSFFHHTGQDIKATSEVSLMYNSQDRPEFHRRVLTGAWAYNWVPNRAPGWQHRLDLISLNYVFMPWISDTFRKDYLEGDDPHYAILRYSYENLFIMRSGYSFTYNSLHTGTPNGIYQTNGYQVRFNFETAGNLLYGFSKLFRAHKNADNQYSLFNIAYSQYAKLDLDFAKSFLIDERNSLALHAFFGIALPYGNSSIIPYEKRYFSGGANSVRGWGVRELGPGSYEGHDGNIDFINQTGNLKLDFSVEYRTFLFWKLHGAAFIDAGNIWNTRDYADQPGGLFRFNTFYKQIAVSYGLGIRLNLDYFILRLDCGMKAINPAVSSGPGHYPIVHPDFNRDFALHFAVGLPF